MKFQINITKTVDGFATEFPFELLESFKAAFKTAKFDRQKRLWLTGPRSGKKLEAWKVAAEDTLVALSTAADAEDEVLDLTKAIAEIQQADAAADARIEELKSHIEDLTNERSKLAEVENAMVSKNAQIKSLAETVATEKDALDAQRAALTERLSTILDLRAVADATAKMKKNHYPRGKQQFFAGMSVIDEARDRLAEAGLGSRALDYLSNVNFNRPDRDKVEYAGDVISCIYEIEDREAA